MPPKRIMVSASDVAVDKRLYVSRQSESVVKSAYVSVTTDRTLDCIVRTLNYVFLNSLPLYFVKAVHHPLITTIVQCTR